MFKQEQGLRVAGEICGLEQEKRDRVHAIALFIGKCLRYMAFALIFFGAFRAEAQLFRQQTETEDLLISVAYWNKKSGLPHWLVSGMFQDSRGYIWMQNQAYLSRFDGQEAQVFDTLDIAGRYPHAFFAEDPNGYIWHYHYDGSGALQIIDPSTFRAVPFEAYVGASSPLAGRAVNRSDDIWLFSVAQQVYLFSREQKKMWLFDGQWRLVYEDRSGRSYAELFVLPAPEGRFWAVDVLSTIALVDGGGQMLRGFSGYDWDGHQLYYADQELYAYAVEEGVAAPHRARSLLDGSPLPGRHESSLTWLPKGFGGVWADFMPHSAVYYSPEGWHHSKPMVFSPEDGKRGKGILEVTGEALQQELSVYLVHTLRARMVCNYRSAGDLGNTVRFLPIKQGGFLQVEMSPKRFKAHGLGTSFRSLCWTNSAQLLATTATTTEQLHVYDPQQAAFAIYPMPYWPFQVACLQSGLWASGNSTGIQQLGEGLKLGKRYDDCPAEAKAGFHEKRGLISVGDSLIWYGTQWGIFELDLRTEQAKSILSDGRQCYWLHKDKNGQHWAGLSEGVYHVESATSFLDTSARRVEHIYEAADGTFWLSTSKGLLHWKPFGDSFQVFGKAQGLLSEELHAAYPDSLGRLWLSSNNGIIAFDTATYAVRNFTVADGLPANEYNYLAHARGADGRLYFGGINGIAAFKPEEFTSLPQGSRHQVHLEAVQQLDSKGRVASLSTRYLPASSDAVEITASCVQAAFRLSMPYFHAQPLRFQWRIPGVSPVWADFDIRQPIMVSGLPQGGGALEVRVRPVADPQAAEVYRFPYFKHEHWHQHAGVQVFALLLLITGGLLWLRWRAKRLQKRNQELEHEVQNRTNALEQKAETIRSQKERLEQIDQAKTQLFNNISHEFRTPLAIVKASVENLKSEGKGSGRTLEDVEQQISALNTMLDEVMDLSKLQMGALENKPVPVLWNAFLERATAMFDGLARLRQIDYRLEILPAEEHYVSIDAPKVERILANLIGNALKFTPEVGRVWIKSELQGGRLQVVVADTGPGIPVSEQSQIFERYQQGRAAGHSPQPGFGIGLALCREYARLLNGKLWVESTPGKGAAFFLELPVERLSREAALQMGCCPQAVPAAVEAPTAALAKAQPEASRHHVLVVEDHPVMLKLLGRE
ncbi:sensor histidine kinase, partial [Phaeodactylibacter luteus]